MDLQAVKPRALAFALVLAGLILGWAIVTDAVSNQTAQTEPSWALRLDPHQPDALLTLAGRALDRGAFDEAAGFARRTLAGAPLEADAFRILAATADQTGHPDAASKLYDFGWSLSRRDPAVAYWLYRNAMAQNRYGPALEYADALLRRSPNAGGVVIPQLVAATADPRAAELIVERLTQGPDWRGAFMQELGRRPPSNAVAAGILHQLARGPTPPLPIEIAPFLNTLATEGNYVEAHRQWVSFLPPSRRPLDTQLYDGDFRFPEGEPPFGWDVTLANGNEARLDPATEGPGLNVYSSGQKGGAVARLLTVLPAGSYRIVSKGHMIEGAESSLEWRLVCVPNARILMRAPFTIRSGGAASAFSADVVIPPDCPAQRLILSALSRDRASRAVAVVEHVGVEAGDAP